MKLEPLGDEARTKGDGSTFDALSDSEEVRAPVEFLSSSNQAMSDRRIALKLSDLILEVKTEKKPGQNGEGWGTR